MNVSAATAPGLEHEKPYGCRLCGGRLEHTFVDLGVSPLCESFLAAGQLDAMEPFFPLHVLVCGTCFLVQLREYVSPEHIFTEYAYFSSYSTSWVAHAKAYCEMIIVSAWEPAVLPLSWPAMTDICCSISCPSACLFSASSRPPMWPRSRSIKAFRRALNFLAWHWRIGWFRKAAGRTSSLATMFLRKCQISTISSPECSVS